jgi:hypothetical protein
MCVHPVRTMCSDAHEFDVSNVSDRTLYRFRLFDLALPNHPHTLTHSTAPAPAKTAAAAAPVQATTPAASTASSVTSSTRTTGSAARSTATTTTTVAPLHCPSIRSVQLADLQMLSVPDAHTPDCALLPSQCVCPAVSWYDIAMRLSISNSTDLMFVNVC